MSVFEKRTRDTHSHTLDTTNPKPRANMTSTSEATDSPKIARVLEDAMLAGPPNTIVTGHAGSGKSTCAKQLAEKIGAVLVCADDHRYHAGSWIKLPADEFAKNVGNAIGLAVAAKRPWVYESSYLDTHDPEDARGKVLRSLLPHAHRVVFMGTHAPEMLQCNILRRSFRRACGKEAGFAAEGPRNVVQLLNKVYAGYNTVGLALENFYKLAIEARLPCFRAQHEVLESSIPFQLEDEPVRLHLFNLSPASSYMFEQFHKAAPATGSASGSF